MTIKFVNEITTNYAGIFISHSEDNSVVVVNPVKVHNSGSVNYFFTLDPRVMSDLLFLGSMREIPDPVVDIKDLNSFRSNISSKFGSLIPYRNSNDWEDFYKRVIKYSVPVVNTVFEKNVKLLNNIVNGLVSADQYVLGNIDIDGNPIKGKK